MKVRIAAAQFSPQLGRESALRWADEAADKGADMVLLPELTTTPYFPMERNADYLQWAEPIPGPTTDALGEVARRRSMYIVVPLFERKMAGVYYNSAALLDRRGSLVGVYRKTHIPAVRSLEKWYFRPGDDLPVFETDFGRVGLLVCQDRVFPEAARVLALKGAGLIAIANAMADYAAGFAMWRALLRTRAFENGVYLAASNRVGTEGDCTFFGHSVICGPMGDVLAEAGHDEACVTADMDLDELDVARSRHHVFRDTRPELYGPLSRRTYLSSGGDQA